MTDELLSLEVAAALMDRPLTQVAALPPEAGIIRLKDEDGRFVYPAWQFRYDGQPFWDVANVLTALGYDHDLTYRFMLEAHKELGGQTGIEYLRMSRNEDLADVALRWLSALPG